jgi:hypothetical protein
MTVRIFTPKREEVRGGWRKFSVRKAVILLELRFSQQWL